MRPRLTPWSFSHFPLWRGRMSWRLWRSTSLKVVRMAAVCWAWTRRSAMRLRILLIGTRLTPLASKLAGVGAWLEAAGRAPAEGEAARGAAAELRGLALVVRDGPPALFWRAAPRAPPGRLVLA